jgi:hypothetical protein
MTEQKADVTPSVDITPSPGDFKEQNQFYNQVSEYAKIAGGIYASQNPIADYKSFVKYLKEFQNTEISQYLLDQIKKGDQVFIFRGTSYFVDPVFEAQHPDYIPISNSSPYIVFVVNPFDQKINAQIKFSYPNNFDFVKTLDNYCGDRRGLEELKCVHAHFKYSSADRKAIEDHFRVRYGIHNIITGTSELRPGHNWTIRTGSVKDSLVISIYKDGVVIHYQYLWDPKAQKWYDGKNQFDTIRDVIKRLGLSEFGSSFYK